MKTITTLLLLITLLVLLPGCGTDKERGINRPSQKKDLPLAAPVEKNK